MNARKSDLVVAGVSKSFGALRVLVGVDLAVRAGEFVTLLGPSGCGKTTLLRIIAGLEVADGGSVRLGEVELTGLPANKRPVNTVFQNYALFGHLNVWENIAFGLRIRRVAEQEVKERVGRAMEMLRLVGLGDRETKQLSGGQKQRVAVARAIVNEPAVLLLDEPLSALDAKLRAEVRVELRHLQKRLGCTFILVTHDQDEAMVVSDRVMVMNRGRIEQEGSPEAVYEQPRTRFVAEFLGAANLICGRRVEGGVKTDWGVLRVRSEVGWDEGLVAIRPERVRVVDSGGENRVEVVVEEVIYRGDHWEVYLRSVCTAPATQASPLRGIRMNSARALGAGQRVWVELPWEHLEVLDG